MDRFEKPTRLNKKTYRDSLVFRYSFQSVTGFRTFVLMRQTFKVGFQAQKRTGTMNSKEHWTPSKVYIMYDQRSETFSKFIKGKEKILVKFKNKNPCIKYLLIS